MTAVTNNQKQWALIGFLVACFLTAVIGGYLTRLSLYDWYPTIVKPWFNPPNWVFPVVWNTLYLLLAFSGWTVWKTLNRQHPHGLQLTATPMLLFYAQLLLNIVWSFLFFTSHQIGWAVVEIVVTALLAWPTLAVFFKTDRLAGLLMLPYVLWLTFAVYLNISLWRLN